MIRLRRQPGVPIHRFGNGFCSGELLDVRIPSVPSACVVHVRCNGSNVFYNAGFFPGFELEIISFGVSLVTHLGDYLRVFPGCFYHQFNFVESTPHRFFHIHVFTLFNGHHYSREMGKIGNCYGNRLNLVPDLIEHHSKVLETFRIRELVQRIFCVSGS
ncbi:hypothetical protein SDC9_127301 [bioreactor metagenome]|uniref:Uncharacterized protein n=1 Tax=bioreactor metagenome TaxID=1076179 RepID=A0A645CTM2_9ZZZZ